MCADESSMILDTDTDLSGQSKNDIAIDKIEEIALRVPAPSKSLRNASDAVSFNSQPDTWRDSSETFSDQEGGSC